MSERPRIKGYCPSCGLDTLFVGEGGYLTCSWVECKNPTAVSDLLADSEIQHIVVLGEDSYTIKHPLIERIDDDLLHCNLVGVMARPGCPPPKPGKYRVYRDGESFTWTEVS